MLPKRNALLMVGAIILLAASLQASSMYEVALRDQGDLETLLRGGFDIAYVSPGRLAHVVIWNDAERSRLDEAGLRYFIGQADLETYYAGRLDPRRDDMGGYPTYGEIVEEINLLHEDFARVVSEPISIGRTIEDRDIWAVKISDNPEDDEDEPEVLFTALIHARELITPMLMLRVMRLLAEEYEQDEYITHLVNEREIWFIPCHNPDGVVQNQRSNPNGGGMWRKNRRHNQDGSIGVDLNRNFGHQWGYDNIGSSPDGDNQTYRGTGPFSEPETQAAREFINEHQFVASIYFHSYSNLCIIPFGYDYVHAQDRVLFTAIADRLTSHNNYWPGTGWETIYLTNGDSDDWIYGSDEHDPILAMTVEIGTQQDGFWPPINRAPQLVQENIPTCLKLIDLANEPRRAFNPLAPLSPVFYQEQGGDSHISWEIEEDNINPPISFQIRTFIDEGSAVDVVTENNPLWKELYITSLAYQPHSAPLCYRVNISSPSGLLTYTDNFLAPDTLWAWVRYNLTQGNCFALDASLDGFDWVPLAGLGTREINPADFSLGPGITGTSNNWVRKWWVLDDFAGQMALIRFRYYRFDRAGRNDYCYIDDIGPLPQRSEVQFIAEDVADPNWTGDIELGQNSRIQVRAVDAEGHLSYWSSPAQEIEAPASFVLPVEAGWSLISAPYLPVEAGMEFVMEPWVQRDVLNIIKNGLGRFYLPRFDFNNIGSWNPLDGYQVSLQSADTLIISGDRLAPDTPIPLTLGWSIVAYLSEQALPAPEAMRSIVDNLILVKDGFGHFWNLPFNFNNLPDLMLGSGYQVKLENADTLIYPADELAAQLSPSPKPRRDPRFSPPSPYNHSILIQFDQPPGEGELIIRNQTGEVSGLTLTNSEQRDYGLAAWEEMDNSRSGLKPNEELKFYWRAERDGNVSELHCSLVAGDETYTRDGFSVFTTQNPAAKTNTSLDLTLSAVPNPFNAETELSFVTPQESRLKIEIFDAQGRSVKVLFNGKTSAGSHRLTWQAADQPSGIYFARLSAIEGGSAEARQIKLLMLR
ncbi:MAG: M14 family zinc carboxypeptidase [Calditrichota bacterium]